MELDKACIIWLMEILKNKIEKKKKKKTAADKVLDVKNLILLKIQNMTYINVDWLQLFKNFW